MRRTLLVCAALAGCRGAPTTEADGAASAASAPPEPAAPSAVAPAKPPLVLRPPGADASREAREKAALDLLAGKPHVAELPLADVDEGATFEPTLRPMLQYTKMSIRIGTVTATAVDNEAIARLLESNMKRLRLCYAAGLRSNPNLAGRIATRVVVKAAGKPTTVADGGSDMPDASVVGCVAKAFEGFDFPAPQGEVGTVTVPLIFSPGG